jgi:hypothetical protein
LIVEFRASNQVNQVAYRIGVHSMTQNSLYSDIYNDMCEAANCFKKATTKIDLKVGNKGVITLDLCNSCIARFVEGRLKPEQS